MPKGQNPKPMGWRPRRVAVTHCPAGHAYTTENTYLYTKDGYTARQCRACKRASARAFWARLKREVVPA